MTKQARKFVVSLKKLAAALKGRDFTLHFVQVTEAPVWQNGEQVAHMTGTFPVARVHGQFVTLLDNGELSMIAEWRFEGQTQVAIPTP